MACSARAKAAALSPNPIDQREISNEGKNFSGCSLRKGSSSLRRLTPTFLGCGMVNRRFLAQPK